MQTILLVEDNDDHAQLALRALKKNNIASEVVVAQDGEVALDYLFGAGSHAGRDPNDTPGLMLLDLNMPKVNGFEVLRRLRSDERTKLIPVVIFTSSREKQDLLDSYGLGANSYIRKPVDSAKFNETMRELGLYWLNLNESPPKKD